MLLHRVKQAGDPETLELGAEQTPQGFCATKLKLLLVPQTEAARGPSEGSMGASWGPSFRDLDWGAMSEHPRSRTGKYSGGHQPLNAKALLLVPLAPLGMSF